MLPAKKAEYQVVTEYSLQFYFLKERNQDLSN